MKASDVGNEKQARGRRGSTHDFLFRKTQVDPDKAKVGDNLPLLRSLPSKLIAIFPNMTKGQAFIDFARERLALSSEFAAMTIRAKAIWPDAEEADELGNGRYVTNLMLELAGVIDSVCRSFYPFGSMWGLLDNEVFGCFFPEKGEDFCMAFANEVRTRFAKSREEPLTMGVALFPIMDFRRDQIMENAWKALDHATFLGPEGTALFDSVSLNISADRLYEKDDIPGAIEELEAALRLDSANANARNSLGVCYGVLGGLEKALDEFEKVLLLDSQEIMAAYNAGLVHMLMGHKAKAIGYFRKASKTGEEVFEVAFQAGRLYLEMEKPREAKAFLEKATELGPDSASAFRCLGDCCAALGMDKEAIRAYQKAVHRNPQDAASLSALGCLFDAQGENPEIAILLCRHSVEIAPAKGLYRYRLGELCFKHNLLDDALREFVKATELGHDAMERIEEIQGRLTARAS